MVDVMFDHFLIKEESILLMKWLQIILLFVFGFSVFIICCGKNTKKQQSKKQEKSPDLTAKQNSPASPKQSPTKAISPKSQTATTTPPRRLGGGPGSTIVPFSKEKMLWTSMVADKNDDKKK